MGERNGERGRKVSGKSKDKLKLESKKKDKKGRRDRKMRRRGTAK